MDFSKVVVTGIGAITSAGENIRQNWNNFLEAKSFIVPLKKFSPEGLYSPNAGEIYLDDEELLSRLNLFKSLKSSCEVPIERGEILLLLALEEALQDANISFEDLRKKKVGLFIGTSLCGFTKLEEVYTLYKKGKRRWIPPSVLLSYLIYNCVDRLSCEIGIPAVKMVFSTACSSSLHAALVASSLIERGEIDVGITGGVDPLSLISLAGFSSLQSLAKERCSPFSDTDPGLSVGEGAGVLILERKEQVCDKRKFYGFILSASGSSDAYHPTASDPTGIPIKNCLESAVKNIQITPEEDVLYFAHGTGTPHNDVVESRAVSQVQKLRNSKVCAVKSYIGHTLGASGIVELCFLVKAVDEGMALPIANFGNPRKGCSLQYVTSPTKVSASVGVKLASAFGGDNVSVCVGGKSYKAGGFNIIEEDVYEEKLAITGIGVVSHLDVFNLDELKSGIVNRFNSFKTIEKVSGFGRKEKEVSVAGVVDLEKVKELCVKNQVRNVRVMDRISLMSALSAILALKDSGFGRMKESDAYKIAAVATTGTGPLDSVSRFYDGVILKNRGDANIFPNTVVNAFLGYITMECNIKGYTTVIAQGDSSPFSAFKLADILLKEGGYSRVLLGGVSEFSVPYLRACIDVGTASKENIQRVYDTSSRGNIIGEGSVFFVVENLKDAKSRGAKIYSIIEDISVSGVPSVPAKFKSLYNPLDNVLDYFSSKYPNTLPKVALCEGDGIPKHCELELEALKRFLPGSYVFSPVQYFGYVSGVNAFFNLLMYSLFGGEGTLPKMEPGDMAIKYGSDLNFLDIRNSGIKNIPMEQALMTGVAPGGSAGGILVSNYF